MLVWQVAAQILLDPNWARDQLLEEDGDLSRCTELFKAEEEDPSEAAAAMAGGSMRATRSATGTAKAASTRSADASKAKPASTAQARAATVNTAGAAPEVTLHPLGGENKATGVEEIVTPAALTAAVNTFAINTGPRRLAAQKS